MDNATLAFLPEIPQSFLPRTPLRYSWTKCSDRSGGMDPRCANDRASLSLIIIAAFFRPLIDDFVDLESI